MRRSASRLCSSLRLTVALGGFVLLMTAIVPEALAAAPPAPVLVYPSGSVPDANPNYRWNASAGATQYMLQVFDSAGTRILQRLYDAAAVCSGSVCQKTESLVLALGNYTWKMKAQNTQGVTWSPDKAFTVIPPAAPVLSAPSGPLTNPTPTYTWSASTGAITYFHQVFDSQGALVFQRSNSAASVCVGTACSYNPGVVLGMGAYTWTMRASHSSGGTTSPPMSFHLGCEANVVLGDFNGDSRTDRLCSASGGTYVSVATGTGFINGALWLNRFVDKPLAADFNADGRTDIAGYDRYTGIFSVALANTSGTGFGTWTQWGVATVSGLTCSGSGPVASTADFNGDGRADVSCKKDGINTPFIGLSSGSGFTFTFFGDTYCDAGERTGSLDMNGDGKSDWYCVGRSNDLMRVYPSLGTSFQATPITAADDTFCNDVDYVFGDWNGDGRTDLGCVLNGKIRLSTGGGYVDQGAFGQFCSNPNEGYEHWPYAFGADVDGDGRAEMICGGMGTGGAGIKVRKWTGTTLGPATTWISGFCWDYVLMGDFDGDGKPDLLCQANQDAAVSGTSKLRPDLVTGVTNPLGGTVTVAYQPATNFVNGAGFGTAPVATSVAVSDGRGSSSTTAYSYQGGQTSILEHQSLGFHSATATLPCLATEAPPCPTSVTTFSQGLASAGSVLESTRSVSNGPLSRQTYTYDDRTTFPRRSRLALSTSTTSGPPGTERSTTVTYEAYDDYGNLTQRTAWGDPADNGDDLQTTYSFALNTTAYIVSRVGQIQQRPPNSAALTIEEHLYDGQNSWQAAPTKGDVTSIRRHLDPDGRWVMRTFEYTDPGSLRKVWDETQRWTELAYDQSWNLYPVSTTTAVGTVRTDWDFACGAVHSTTDLNDQTTTSTYDNFCRLASTDEPATAGGFLDRQYLDLGNPSLQRTRVETNAPPGVSGVAWTESYFDGLGRTYRTASRGPSGSDSIVVDQTFNARGQVNTATRPYYEGDTPLVTSYAYDALDRVTRVNLPGSGSVQTSYTASSQTVTDPNAKPATTRFDYFGRVKTVERPFGGQTAITTTHYDRLGRRDSMTDPVQATWTWSYDSLGRLREEFDPDRGKLTDHHWTYAYDDAGSLLTQTDAKGQATSVTYDDPGRILTRQNAAGLTTYSYGEPRSGFFNLGRLTTVTFAAAGKPLSILRFDHDELGRVQKQWPEVDGQTYTVTKEWAPGGYHLTTTYPDPGNTVGPIGYDEAGRVKSIAGILNTVTYDASGRPLQRVNANPTSTTWTYSLSRGVLESMSTTGGSLNETLTYDVDDAGLVWGVTGNVAAKNWQYDYDDFYHLREAQNTGLGDTQTFTYDAGDRIVSNSRIGTYEYPLPGQPRPHAPSFVNGSPYTYDYNGNLTSGGGRAPVWNADNLIDQVGTTQFSYDALGERIKKTDGSTTSLFPFGDDYEITNGVTTTYISVEGLGVVAKKVSGGSDPGPFWIHTDHLGSIDAVTRFDGTIAFQRDYRPYGETLTQDGSHTESRGWIDQRNDPESGLTYLHARYYDPQLGVFVSPDPLRPDLPGVGGNRYVYGLGNSVNLTDRSGFAAWVCEEKVILACVGYEYPTSTKDQLCDHRTTLVCHVEAPPPGPLGGMPPPTTPGGGSQDGDHDNNSGGTGSQGGNGGNGGGDNKGKNKSCSVGTPSIGVTDYVSGFVSTAWMFGEFLSGLGSADRAFGPGSVESRMMASSPGVTDAVNAYLSTGQTSGLHKFGLSGAARAGNNPIRQFVGSYTYTISPVGGGLNLTIDNSTSVWSGSYHQLDSHERSTFRPTGTTHQTYQVSVRCRE